MASNLSKGYADIDEPGTRKPAPLRPRTTTTTTTEKPEATKKTPAKTSYREPKKIVGKKRYERLEEKSTPSHDIGESKTEILAEHAKLKGDLDRSDKRYYALKDRLLADEAKGTVQKGAAAKFAAEMERWQEDAKNQFRGWVDETVEKNRVNKKAAGTFNNMLEDAEEALTDLDSRPGPEKYFQVKTLEAAQRRKYNEEQALKDVPEESNVVGSLEGLIGPEGQAAGAGGMAFTPEQLAESADKSGFDRSAKGVQAMFETMYDKMYQEGKITREGHYKLKQDLKKKMEVMNLEGSIGLAKRKLEAKPEEKSFWDQVKGVAGSAIGTAADVGGRVLDVASRPLYATAGAAESFLEGGLRNPGMKLGPEFVKGLTGEDKTTFTDVLSRQVQKTKKSGEGTEWWENALVAAGGLGLDIVADPITYLSLGTTTLGKKAMIETAKEIGSPGVVKAIMTEAVPEVRRGRRVLEPFEIATKTADYQNKLKETKKFRDLANKMRREKVLELTKQGIKVEGPMQKEIFEDALEALTKVDSAAYETAIRSGNKPRMAVRFAGKDIGDVPAVGRALAKANVPATAIRGAYKSTGFGRAMQELFNMRAHFPGVTDRLRRLSEAKGLVNHTEFQAKVDKILGGLTKDERKQISHAMEIGEDLSTIKSKYKGKDLGDIQKELRGMSDDLWHEKVTHGLAKDEDYGENYLFHYYRGDLKTGPKEIKRFKLDRRTRIRRHLKAPTLKEAKEAGMNPYEDVGDILKLQNADHQRKISRVHFKHEVMNQYGLLSDSPAVAKANGLVDVTSKLPENLKTIALKQNKRYYLHRDIADVFGKLDQMHSLAGGEEAKKFMRYVSRMTNWWKSTATVYNPGNWVNNSLGDISLNYFDGVQHPKWYQKAFEVVMRGKMDDKVILKLGGKPITREKAWELYKKYGGSAGFLRADVDEVVGRVAPRLRHKVHTLYQKREDMSRFAHFLYSLEDEFKRVPKANELGRFPKGFEKRLDEAGLAASDRVAKFNIDYSAFTPFERKLKGGAVPFYSWMRKAFPLMLENLFMRPGRYSAQEKMMKAFERTMGGAPDEYNGEYNVHYPQWLQDIGFLRKNGGRNPTVFKNPLPSNIFGDIFGGGDLQGLAQNTLSNLHPALQVPMEVAFGKQLYSGGQIGNPEEYALSKFPITGLLQAATGYELPGQPEWTKERRIGRLTGQTPYTITDKMQAGELRRQQDPLDQQVRKLNQEIYPIQIEQTDKGFVVTNDENGRRFNQTFADPKDAYMVALQLKKLDGSPPGSGG